MTARDQLIARGLGGVVFGACGSAASMFVWQVTNSGSASPLFFQAAALSAFVVGILLGPRMMATVLSGGFVSGVLATYCASLMSPIFLLGLGAIKNSAFPAFRTHDLETLAALPWIAMFVMIPALPFGMLGGVLFSRAVRAYGQSAVVRDC